VFTLLGSSVANFVVPPLTIVGCPAFVNTLSLYLGDKFQWNSPNIIFMWVAIYCKGFQGRRSKVKVILRSGELFSLSDKHQLKPAVRCTSVNTYFTWCDISELSGGISAYEWALLEKFLRSCGQRLWKYCELDSCWTTEWIWTKIYTNLVVHRRRPG